MKNLYLSLFAFMLLASVSAQVTNRNFNEEGDRKDWSYSFTPYGLLASQSTDVGGQQIRQSFGDLASLTNAGFQFVASVRYKRFGLSVDGTFATLGKDLNEEPILVNFELKQRIIDVKGSYVIYETFEMEDNRVIDGWSIEALGGAKYWVNDIGVDFALAIDGTPIVEDMINQRQKWWDMMLGVRTTISLSRAVLLGASINFGGFGLGNSSKSAYDFTYYNAFRVSRLITINAGFRNFRYRREDVNNGETLNTRVNVLGPFLGVSLFFN
ncbi:MAG: hypothetical protein ABF293_04700 [Flavobacteriaceae bacterium]